MPGVGRPVVNPPVPKAPPAPRPVANLHTGNNPRGVAIVAPRPVVRAPAPRAVSRSPGSDIQSSGAGYGSARANAYKATPAYRNVVAHVFRAQPPAQKAAIIRGLSRQNLFNSPEYRAIRPQWDHLSLPERSAISNLIPKDLPKFIAPKPGPDIFSELGHLLSPKTFLAGEGSGSGARLATRGTVGATITGSMFGGPKGGGQLLKNLGSDVVNYLPNTVEGLYNVGSELQKGQFGNAFHSFVDPIVHTILHPAQSFYQHPGDTAAMFLGPKAIIGKGFGAAARVGTFGDRAAATAATAREPLSLGTVAGEPSPIVEARSYSNDVVNKAVQVAREKYLRKRGRNPNIAQPAPRFLPQPVAHAFNLGSEAKLHRISDEMTAVRQMAGRQERARALNALHKAAPSKAARNIVTHIVQGVVRTPETAVGDISKEIIRLKAAQTGRRTVAEIANRNQVRDLSTALKTPGAIDEAFRAAAPIRELLHNQDKYLVAKGLLNPDTAMGSKLLPYAMAHMGVTGPHPGIEPQFPGDIRVPPGFKGPSGEHISVQDVLDHLQGKRAASAPSGQAPKVPDPAFVGHFPNKVAPHRFYAAYKLARGSLGQKTRTGEAFRSGAYDHTYEGLAGQVASRTETVTKATLHDNVVSRMGILKPKDLQAQQIKRLFAAAHQGKVSTEHARREAAAIRTGLFTPTEARQFAQAALHDDHGNPIPNATELTPISTAPANVMEAVRSLQDPHELQHLSATELRAVAHAITDAAGRSDQTRNVALIPTEAAQRFAQQFARTDSNLRQIGRVTQQFRRTVLPYSTHWMLQIGTEAGIRALLGGVLSPHYLADGRRLMKRLEGTDPGRAALMEMVNATFYNKRDPLAVHNPNPGVVSSAAHAFPPSRLLIAAHNKYADTIGHAMYTLEHNARLMGLGKLAHQEIAEFTRSWQNAVHIQGRSLDELSHRLQANPALVAKFGRQIDDTFGKYNKFSPQLRGAIQSIAPFLPWYLNAAKYVLWHLPAHHPVATSLLAATRQTINQDIQQGKQMPLDGFAMQQLARLSPFGIFTPDKPGLDAALKEGIRQGTSVFLPQVMGTLYNLAGVNSFGEGPLKGPGGDVKAGTGPSRAAAAENTAESFLPILSRLREAREGGRPSYGTSTIVSPQPKPGGPPGSVGTILNRIFNPFYSFERAKKSAGGSGSGSTLPTVSGGGDILPAGGSGGGDILPAG